MSHIQGKANFFLYIVSFHKFRGTDMAYRFTTLDYVSGKRFTLEGIIKHSMLVCAAIPLMK